VKIAELWRHPVKSFQGEPLDEAVIEANGMAGDRMWGVRDEATGRILTGRRQPELLFARARLAPEGDRPIVDLPDGTVLDGLGDEADHALSAWLGKPVRLVDARDVPASQAEFFSDATNDDSLVVRWTLPAGRFVDVFPLLLLTTATLREGQRLHPGGVWDVRRFRPNVLIETDEDGWPEDAWVGQDVQIGDVGAHGMDRCDRCTMITRPQPGLERDVDLFKGLKREHNAQLGTWAAVRAPGVLRVGDPVSVG
jgi:uncharacterized protein